ncbi:MAG: amino acid ABC transporter permease [Chthoniobacterales bacterium]
MSKHNSASFFLAPPSGEVSMRIWLSHVTILLLIFSFFSWGLLASQGLSFDFFRDYRVAFWRGWLTTIFCSVVALILSLFLGFLTAIARRSRFLPLRALAGVYVQAVRGTPLLVLILFGFYIFADQVGLQDRFVAGVLILSLFSAAYMAEIIRSGIEGVPKTQIESARSLGFTPFQIYRYVILPQALRQMLPPLAGQLASLIKDSSLLSVISISEFTFVAQQVASATYGTFESYLVLLVGYLILTLPVMALTHYFERRNSFEN